jgi:Type II secretion system (T2SS), protein E, N-terminal domain
MPFLMKKTGTQNVDGRSMDVLAAESNLKEIHDKHRRSRGQTRRVDPTASTQRRLCGNMECASTWTAPWRNRRRPIFEGQWGCSERCILAMVKAATNRELGDSDESIVPHRHRVPLGLVMLAQGWITHPQLRRALEAQRANGSGRIGDWLVAECGLETEQITRALSMQWSCPVLSIKGFEPEAMALAVPKVFVEEFGVLPLRVAGRRLLYLAFEDRLDASIALAVEQMTDLKVESGLMDGAQFREARSMLLQYDAVELNLETATSTASLSSQIMAIVEQKQPIASRLVRLRQYYWLRIWLESGAVGNHGSLPRTNEDVSDHIFTIGTRA